MHSQLFKLSLLYNLAVFSIYDTFTNKRSKLKLFNIIFNVIIDNIFKITTALTTTVRANYSVLRTHYYY